MSEIIVSLDDHGVGTNTGDITVTYDEGRVHLNVISETDDCIESSRSLRPDEARALAAALQHYSFEAEL